MKIFKHILFIILISFLEGRSGLKISGIVLDASNDMPIPGVNIMIKGTESGGVGDENGKFSINSYNSLPITLFISHIAYQRIEYTVVSTDFLLIRLEPAVLQGNEVYIIGEKSAAEKDITSSVEIISIRQVEKRGMRDLNDVLQEVGSVNIITSTYGRQKASIRGSNPNEVSVYLDGARLNRSWDGEANLAFVDLGDLEQVEIIRGGNSTLFGSGNFGGVILMSSKRLDRNHINFSRSLGLSHSSDQDLSGSASLKKGSFAVGGRASGKSRLFDGRTLYTTIFNNYAGSYDNGSISATLRTLQHENFTKFASGGNISTDKMKMNQFGFSGNIFSTKDWEFQWGEKNWIWDDEFFSTARKSLRENSSTIRISKTFNMWRFNGTLLIEEELLDYTGDNAYSDSYSSRNWTDKTNLERKDTGLAGVLRFQQENPATDIDLFRVEFGMRNGTANYKHDQEISEFDSTFLMNTYNYNFNATEKLITTRLGMFMKGRLPHGNRFEFFFSQGTNHRLPTLEDYFLWGIGLEQMKDYSHDLEILKPPTPVAEAERDLKLQTVKLVLLSMRGGLKREYVSTTELNFKFIFNQLRTKPVSNSEIGFSIFRNSYLDKIAYRQIPKGLSAAFNTSTAWMNGFEIRGRTHAWNNQFKISGNMMWVKPSDELIFPETPSSRGNIMFNLNKGYFHANLSHIIQGPQKYIRGGVVLNQDQKISNTNIALSLEKQFRYFNFQISYAVRNIFSNESIVVNNQNISGDGSFNYYDAHRQLLTFKISMLGE